jgi:hypothetical protein
MKQYTAFGSHGHITYDATGLVVDRYHNGSDEDYGDVARVDVAEYLAYNGELDDTDVLLIGWWTTDGKYEPPCQEHRQMLADEAPEYEAERLARVATLTNR